MTPSSQLSDQHWQPLQPLNQPGTALREDPDVAQLRATSLRVFNSSTATMALLLMQSRILDVAARARSAGHLADWQIEGDIVISWIDKLKAQGRDTGIAFYTGINDFYQPLRDFLHPLYASLRLFTPLYKSTFAKQQHKSAIILIWFWLYHA